MPTSAMSTLMTITRIFIAVLIPLLCSCVSRRPASDIPQAQPTPTEQQGPPLPIEPRTYNHPPSFFTDDDIARADVGNPPNQVASEVAMKVGISMRLKDPDSAVFRIGKMHKAVYAKPDTGEARFAWALEALVNAKNSFGGYTGYKLHAWYFVNEKLVAVLRPPSEGLGESGDVIMEVTDNGIVGGRTEHDAGLPSSRQIP